MTDKTRYAIGIDLGTTNCSLAYRDLQAPDSPWQVLQIPQWESEGQIARDVRLPSFAWILPKSLVKQGTRRLPWQAPEDSVRVVLGREAKARSLDAGEQVAFAAKSWLSVGPKSTREARILPWGSQTLIGDQKLSPVEVQTLLLQHLAAAWNSQFAAGPEAAPFFEQKIVITVPASYDELAQRLTLAAANAAGYPAEIELLEEPQAAFYAWFAAQTKPAAGIAKTILVCDVGGGTCDFTLLRLGGTSSSNPIERLRVSEHLLLGGDNIDLSLAEHLQAKLGSESLPRKAWMLLIAQARHLKEAVLCIQGDPHEEFFVSVPLSSGSLFGAYASTSIRRVELYAFIEEGFFPQVRADAKTLRSEAALRPLGLAYAEDSAITRHLAEFLRGEVVDQLLCAGGSLLPELIRLRLRDIIQSWQTEHPLELLSLPEADLAIAQGAAWYAAERVLGTQVVASPYPRSLYLELYDQSGKPRYMCIVAKGQARQTPVRHDHLHLALRLGQTVRFQLFSSLQPALSETDIRNPDWKPLPPLTAQLKTQGKPNSVPVVVESLIRETGLLELRCCHREDEQQQWILDFSVEDSSRSELRLTSESTANIEAKTLNEVRNLLNDTYGKTSASAVTASMLSKQLEILLSQRREDWSLATLRTLADLLLPLFHKRDRSPEHEASWYQLCGFCLRPGWGTADDPDRLARLWPYFDHGISRAHAQERRLQEQYAIFWRRAAGGLSAQQQEKIYDRIMPQLRKAQDLSAELIRLAGSLERLPLEKKVSLGRMLVQQLTQGLKDQVDSKAWAIARISTRFPLYAGAESIVPPHIVEEWAKELETIPWPSKIYQRLSLFYHWAGRKRDEKLLDLEPEFRAHFIERLTKAGASTEVIESLRVAQKEDLSLRQQQFGESLPAGFILES